MPYKIKPTVTRKFETENYFHYYLCYQLKVDGMEIIMDKIALITEKNGEITYDEMRLLEMDALRLIPKRCLVFVVVDNNMESVVIYSGCLKRKIVPLLLHKNISLKQLEELKSCYLPQYIMAPSEYHVKLQDYIRIGHFENYYIWQVKEKYEYELYEELALLLSTSGSTGSPKCVRISYNNLKSNTESICKALDIREEDVAITTLPMDYTYGLSIINTHLYKNATIVLNTVSVIHKAFWDKITKYHCTTLGGVPYIYQLIDRLKLNDKLLDLRYVTQAGGKLEAELVEKYRKIFLQGYTQFIVMYGQTEATARISYLPWENIEEHYSSIGFPIPGGNLYVIDEEGKRISKTYQKGELVYEGENVTLGYASGFQDLKYEDERKGKLLTGDYAYFDEQGFFYVVGRKKRMVKIYGNRINMDEIESYLKTKGYNVLCIGSDNKIVILCSTINDEKSCSDIKQVLIEKGVISSSIVVKLIEKIPRGESGKVNYVDLEKLYL